MGSQSVNESDDGERERVGTSANRGQGSIDKGRRGESVTRVEEGGRVGGRRRQEGEREGAGVWDKKPADDVKGTRLISGFSDSVAAL